MAFTYSGQGFIPVVIANRVCPDVSAIRYLGQQVIDKYPVLQTWKIGSPLTINADSVITSRGMYDEIGGLSLQSLIPIVEGYKDYTSPGVQMSLIDPFQFNSLTLSASYSPSHGVPDNERFHALMDYQSFFWKVRGGYNPGNFYDLFGPTKSSRKGYFGSIAYHDLLIYDKPRIMDYTISVAGYGGLETLPEYQNVAATFSSYFSLSANVTYNNLSKSLGAIDDEAGVRWEVNSLNKYASSTLFPLLYANFDYGFLLPIDHSFIWLRTSFGNSFNQRTDPFASFYFGGFGNNWVDHQTEKRYREYYSFPGVPLNAIGGKNYAKGLFEWTLPPLRFKHFGIPNFYLTWARLALFSSSIVTNVASDPERRTLFNCGAQLDFRFVVFSHLDNTLSFGYAAALELNQRAQKEFMVSLKIF